ncbi:hypothetical protein PIB30_075884 [Stylosanthes scabra]|uniref:Putative plant transposon protein domain-containing protein n=1 Tax=Stylosanthes scabra TaxID=79078 RepID=A0ABU6WNF8_9FABA|nr:hypothetical protein [Stylosanthes scabra]
MADLLRKRKGKAAASTSEAPRFKTLYHEAHFNKFFSAREARRAQEPTTPYTTQIKGTEINFSPEFIHRVLKLRDTPLPNAASYHDTKANNNLRLDEVLACLCMEGAQWVRYPDGRPHFLRRTNLQPMARGWYEFVCRSIMPTANHSEVNVEQAVLIHAIIIGENIQVDEIIVEQM